MHRTPSPLRLLVALLFLGAAVTVTVFNGVRSASGQPAPDVPPNQEPREKPGPAAEGDEAEDPVSDDVPELDPELEALFDEGAEGEGESHDGEDGEDGDEGDDVEFFDEALLDRLAFAGSAQIDYLYVPTNEAPRDLSLDGFTTELSL